MNKPVILLTGGAGFIGSHIVEQFSKEYQIIVFDNYTTGKNIYKSNNVCYIYGDIRDKRQLEKLPNFDYCIHLAAAISVVESVQNPQKYYNINIQGSQNVFDVCATHKCKKIIVSSSAAIYGDCGKDAIVEEQKYGGISPYAESKYKMEQLDTHGVELVVCRFFNVFGQRQNPKSPYTGVMSIFIDRAINKKQIQVFGDGLQTRDFIFVKDLVNAIKILMENKTLKYHIYNIGYSQSTSLNDLLMYIKDISQNNNLDITYQDSRQGDIKYSLSNNQKLLSTGWNIKYGMNEGMKQTFQWSLEGNDEQWL